MKKQIQPCLTHSLIQSSPEFGTYYKQSGPQPGVRNVNRQSSYSELILEESGVREPDREVQEEIISFRLQCLSRECPLQLSSNKCD